MIDNADGSLYGFSLQNHVIDTALIGLILGGFLQPGEDEDVKIGDIFISDMAFGVCICYEAIFQAQNKSFLNFSGFLTSL